VTRPGRNGPNGLRVGDVGDVEAGPDLGSLGALPEGEGLDVED
jgi:hypothetical protein